MNNQVEVPIEKCTQLESKKYNFKELILKIVRSDLKRDGPLSRELAQAFKLVRRENP